MAKSDKITVAARVHDVLRLILVGAEFADIRQYASEHGWQVSERQIRRYIEAAHRRFAKATRRDRSQLMGRHLMQRRALYARAMKASDLKTALQVLRDEAELQGLYPSANIASTRNGQSPFPGSNLSPLTLRERVVRMLAADADHDHVQRRLLDQATPYTVYRLPDTMMPIQMLSIMALMYVGEQLEAAVMVVNAMFSQTIDDDPNAQWERIGLVSAYRFRIGREGWEQFNTKSGVNGDYLVRGNHEGVFLDLYADKICDLAPAADEVKRLLADMDPPSSNVKTADDLCRSWQRLFLGVCRG